MVSARYYSSAVLLLLLLFSLSTTAQNRERGIDLPMRPRINKPTSAQSKENVTLRCSFECGNECNKGYLSWRSDILNKTLNYPNKVVQSVQTHIQNNTHRISILDIFHAERKHTGTYTCQWNFGGRKLIIESQNLIVHGPIPDVWNQYENFPINHCGSGQSQKNLILIIALVNLLIAPNLLNAD